MTDRQPPRLSVGVISAGAVGTAVARVALAAGHDVRVVSRSGTDLPVPVVGVEEAAQAALVVLAVPDPVLPEVVERVARTTRDGQIVAHTSGAHGCAVLQPVTDTGALPLALHPVMTFTGEPDLAGCPWGVTADGEAGLAVAQVLVSSFGGVPVVVPEEARPAYHAAVAHAANHTVTLLSDALAVLDRVTDAPETLLRRIVPAAVEAALDRREAALTGPAARNDVAAVLRHVDALRDLCGDGGVTGAYIHGAVRTAQLAGAADVEWALTGRQ
ncbi:DUF2520 domain-containing protein [Corynebacterium bovis]|nr:DUF2520 domain-containing protein [Corynebacterium bovis]MDN8579349.1 DUF2520 domain-containing protein [Corynebacterium bovis]